MTSWLKKNNHFPPYFTSMSLPGPKCNFLQSTRQTCIVPTNNQQKRITIISRASSYFFSGPVEKKLIWEGNHPIWHRVPHSWSGLWSEGSGSVWELWMQLDLNHWSVADVALGNLSELAGEGERGMCEKEKVCEGDWQMKKWDIEEQLQDTHVSSTRMFSETRQHSICYWPIFMCFY